jgi:hypothetical protein
MHSRALLETMTVVALASAEAACASDSVAPGYYGTPDDAAVQSVASPGLISVVSPADPAQASAVDDASGAGDVEGGTATSPACDLNGRWLVASRVLADALGQKQASHNWFYYEIRQDADQVTVTRGLHCGYQVVAVTPLGADVDSHLAWPALLAHQSDTGRTGSMSLASAGCQVQIDKQWNISGATVAAYSDPSLALPTPAQQASGATPGWEDWDEDGHPGITLSVSGAASGDLYLAQRDWSQWSGSVAASTSIFKIAVTWGEEQDPLGYTGSSLVTQSAAIDSDPTQHYVWFARLDSTQATGDPTAICAAVRALVPSLAPDALN